MPCTSWASCSAGCVQVTRRLKELGYTYVALDLQGYRTGAMNEGMAKS